MFAQFPQTASRCCTITGPCFAHDTLCSRSEHRHRSVKCELDERILSFDQILMWFSWCGTSTPLTVRLNGIVPSEPIQRDRLGWFSTPLDDYLTLIRASARLEHSTKPQHRGETDYCTAPTVGACGSGIPTSSQVSTAAISVSGAQCEESYSPLTHHCGARSHHVLCISQLFTSCDLKSKNGYHRQVKCRVPTSLLAACILPVRFNTTALLPKVSSDIDYRS